ncbi:MAG: apolipoprotein N-acyltransferase, partial [Pseudonocardiales bacterium]|nr:apolipoprotein N-acyltransferase [Pseudonocardiales bacterium]
HGAQMLVVQTNNATFGHTAETYQQLAMSRLRAVETGRTVVQVATSGKSAIISPAGNIEAQSGALFTPDILVQKVTLSSAITPAVRFGVWWEIVLAAFSVIALLASLPWRRVLPMIGPKRQQPAIDPAAQETADAVASSGEAVETGSSRRSK